MNQFIKFLVQMGIAIPTTGLVWIVSFFGFGETFLLSSTFSLVGGAFIYWILSMYLSHRFLKKHGLTNREYKYIKKNLNEAKKKINRMAKTIFSIRHLPTFKQRLELVRTSKKIYTLTKKEPKRFYDAERFYFSHLDSAVELTEKFIFLSAQPKRNRDLEQSLKETRKTLEELTQFVHKDLYHILSNDIDDLHLELDVAKQVIETTKETRYLDESRKLK